MFNILFIIFWHLAHAVKFVLVRLELFRILDYNGNATLILQNDIYPCYQFQNSN